MTVKHYVLEDVNPYYYNCGHYPHWLVREVTGPMPDPVPATRRGTPLAYADESAAAQAADRMNRASARSWREYLDA